MSNLLRADFYRIRKDVILLITLILLAFFAVLSPGIYYLMKMTGGDALAQLEAMGMVPDGRSVFISSMSLTNNFGMFMPILIGILVCRDFTLGTVKNKIITGHSKASVYLSHFVTSVVLGTVLLAVYSLLSLGLGNLMLGYGREIDSVELLYLLKVFLMGVLIFATASALAAFLAALTRSVGITIVLLIAFSIVMSLLGSLPYLPFAELPEWFEKLLRITPAYQISLTSSGKVSGELFATSLISSAAGLCVLLFAGTLLFSKADQK